MRIRRGFKQAGLLILLLMVTACSANQAGLEEGKVNVVTSFYPLYDFTKKIGGEHVHVINLVPAGVDAHDWAPKSRDIVHMTEADLLIYNGLGFEGWLDDFLESLDSDANVKPVSATALLEPIVLGEEHEDEEQAHEDDHGHEEEAEAADDHGHEEEVAADDHAHDEEQAHEDDHGHEHEEAADDHGHDHGGYDPHTWVSPLSAKLMAEQILHALIEVDPEHTDDYEANYEKLAAQFDALDQELRTIIDEGNRSDIVVSHHAYGYLERDYGLEQVAVMGISPESEPTPQDMKHIAQYVQEHEVQYILFEELASSRLADILAQEAGVETLVFNPVEGLTEEQAEAGEDYFSVMQRNLTSLEKALQ